MAFTFGDFSQPVSADRCVCIHSQLQFVDTVLQNVMLFHKMLPLPLSALQEDQQPSLSKTLGGLEMVRSQLREMFRSARRLRISAIRFHVAGHPFRPKYVYEVPICVCDSEDSTEISCGQCCQQLMDAELRALNRHFFRKMPIHGAKEKADRLFIFFHASPNVISENIEECDNDMEICSIDEISLRHEKCDKVRHPDSAGHVWMRLVSHVQGTSTC